VSIGLVNLEKSIMFQLFEKAPHTLMGGVLSIFNSMRNFFLGDTKTEERLFTFPLFKIVFDLFLVPYASRYQD